MEEIISKERVEELMKLKGELRGGVLKTDIEFLIRRKGKEWLKKIEEEIGRLGYSFRYKEIKTMDFYPIGLRAVSFLVMKKVLKFSDEDIREMGGEVPKSSFLTRLFMKYYLDDIKSFFFSAPKIWKKFVTEGQFVPVSFDEENKIATLLIKGFESHPLFCVYLEGIITTFLKMLTGSQESACKEVKCSFRGDEHHEFLLTW